MRDRISMPTLPGLEVDQGRNSAVLSACGRYRYVLTRGWRPQQREAVWIMLNPSTADAVGDDPTIRRCRAFARSWGCGGLTVVNLYAWRAPHPADLRRAGRDSVGPQNDRAIRDAARTAARQGWPVIAAWGAHATAGRVRDVVDITTGAGIRLQCLGTTKAGCPRHPLYVPAGTSLQPYPPPGQTARTDGAGGGQR